MRRVIAWLLLLLGVALNGFALSRGNALAIWALLGGLVCWAVGLWLMPFPFMDDVLGDPCPSCGGSGWAVVRADRVTYAQGVCRCVGGSVWAA